MLFHRPYKWSHRVRVVHKRECMTRSCYTFIFKTNKTQMLRNKHIIFVNIQVTSSLYLYRANNNIIVHKAIRSLLYTITIMEKKLLMRTKLGTKLLIVLFYLRKRRYVQVLTFVICLSKRVGPLKPHGKKILYHSKHYKFISTVKMSYIFGVFI